MNLLIQHTAWPALKQVDQTLRQAGYQSLLAGGAVRDYLLKRSPQDLDLATNATPEQVEQLFAKTILVGKAFGVIRVVIEGHEIEVATFRQDGPYLDGRRPESVKFSSAQEDARRRDFTVNAMFLDVQTFEVIDYVGGRADLANKVIRTVGEPSTRFTEDKLRILRGIRFYSQLGFELDAETRQAIGQMAAQIREVSMERVQEEWEKLLLGKYAVDAIKLAEQLGVISTLFPDCHLDLNRLAEIFKTARDRYQFLDEADKATYVWCLWWALIFDGISQEAETKIKLELNRWKLAKQTQDTVLKFHRAIELYPRLSQGEPVDWALEISSNNSLQLLPLVECFLGDRLSSSWQKAKSDMMAFFQQGKLPPPLVSGGDLIALGLKPGPRFQQLLHQAHRIQLLSPKLDQAQVLEQLRPL